MTDRVRHDYLGETSATTDVHKRTGRAARIHLPGDPLKYSWGNEYRDASELARVAEQLIGKPLTLHHPEGSRANAFGMVGDGAIAHIVGKVENAYVVGDYVEVNLVFTDDAGPRAVARGMKDLSMGYRCTTDDDGFQRGTVVDHLALVWRGRCTGPGGTCSLRGDCACDAPDPEQVPDAPRRESPSEKVEVQGSGTDPVQGCACKTLANLLDIGQIANHMPDDKEKALMDEMNKKLAEAHADGAAQKARADQAEKDRDAQKVRADAAEKAKDEAEKDAHNARKDLEKVQGSIDAEKARADQAEKDAQETIAKAKADADAAAEKVRADAAAELAAHVNAKVALITQASPIIGKDEKGQPVDLVKMSDRDIKLAVIKHVDGDDLTGKNDGWVDGVYEGALKRAKTADASRADAGEALSEMRDPAKKTEPKTGRAAEQRALDADRARYAAQWKNTDKKDQE